MKVPLLRALHPRPATVQRIVRRWRRAVTVIAAFGLGAGGLAIFAPASPALAAAGCTAAYSVQTDWGSGFTAQLVVTNTGTTAITGWTVTYSYTGNQALANGWSGNWTESGENVTVTNASWNGALAVGANSGALGANFNYSGTNVAPASVSCTPTGGGGGGTTPTINATPTSLSVVQGGSASFSLALSAAPTSNETVNISSSGNSGLTASPTTLTFTPSNFATGQTVTVTANTTSTGPTTFTAAGSGYTSATVTATETAKSSTGSITATPTSLTVNQSGTGTFTLALSQAPTSNETVTVAASGNTGLTASPTTLTFTPSNFATAQTVTVTANATGSGTTTFTASGSGYTSATVSATENPGGTTPTLMISPASQTITQGLTGTVGISLSSAPSANVTVSVARTSGNTGLTASPTSLTFTPSNFSAAQSVTITADSSSTGVATFTVSGTGLTSATFTATEATAQTGGTHVADPFTGTKPYLNPDYVSEVKTQAAADGNPAAELAVANFQTAIWLDTMASINGGTTATGTRTGLMQQLTNAAAQGTASTPSLVEIVIYDLPGRDCAALASNGEIPATSAGLTTYETDYINPIANILQQFATANIRVVAIIEPDSLPNVVTNQSLANCQTATPFYEQGIEYALNKLHAISNVYNYLDIAHSAWLGWPSNMSATPAVYNTVVKATTAGYASIDGFISDTANYTPTQEPLLPNPTLSVGGTQIDSVLFYQFNPTFDELTYDTDMYNTLVSAGFPSSKKFLIDTSRNGWGPTHPTTITNASDAVTYVNDNKIDKRPFRGDWCNQNNAGIGARPTDQPFGSSSPILAFVWIKPPGESDGDYPTSTHTHGDPHCDPNGTNTDGSGNSYSTGSIPGFDVSAGLMFPAEFQMLVKNAFPAL